MFKVSPVSYAHQRHSSNLCVVCFCAQAYGIGVGYRHLSLIADYMTFQGEFRAFNRHAISRGKDSPFLKMSYETTANFAVNAALFGEKDALTSPAGQLVVGTVPRVGTGCVDIIQPLRFPQQSDGDDGDAPY